MSNYFYRYWLPFSIAVHVVLVISLIFVKPTRADEPREQVTIVQVADVTIPNKPVEFTPPEKSIEIKAPTQGVPNPRKVGGAGQNPIIDHTPGPGKTGPTIAVNTMVVSKSDWSAPKGSPDGMGRSATGGSGEPGPSEGAGVLGSLHAGNSKIAADERLDGKVTVKVNVSATGAIVGSPIIVQSSGSDELDNAAKRAARASHFQPALKDGKPAAGSVTILFPFNDGKGLTPSVLERN